MPQNYSQELAERVISRHASTQPLILFKKRSTLAFFIAAASFLLLVGGINLWNSRQKHTTLGQTIPVHVIESAVWNDEKVTEADLLLILTGEESEEMLNFELESDSFIF